ncbi:MIT domain-containing protein [Cryptosporidium andersoni]|uniref:MIT domain-containing protein n=1 Tax=Cryptosporidium andersoni TaxID=117008 RepID=A0A1J4MK73_9CRYT|nr:MIT domain-containing protein [Cryptosporidium andersoni]
MDEMMNKTMELIQQGSKKESCGEYQEALDLYLMALQRWNHMCKYQTDLKIKNILISRMEQLVTRAENIKKVLNNNSESNKYTIDINKHDINKNNTSSNDPLREMITNCIVVESPNIYWDDIAGLITAKASLKEAVLLPIKFPQLFKGNLKPWKGILLYGPPGTGKTYLAKACATELNGTFLTLSSADLTSKWQGESEKLIKSLFDIAREKAPSIIFIDEVDSLCSSRNDQENESSRRIKTEFLVQMDGINSGMLDNNKSILVLGATNVPWDLDIAIRRRFERRIYIPLPDYSARKQIILQGLKNTNHNLTSDDISYISEQTNGFSASDVSILIKDALFEPIRKCSNSKWFKKIEKYNEKESTYFWTPYSPNDTDQEDINNGNIKQMSLYDIPNNQLLPPILTKQDLINVLSKSKSSISINDISKYEDWTKLFGLSGE